MGWTIPLRIQRGRLDDAEEAMPPALHSRLPALIWAITLVSQPSNVDCS